MPRKPTDLARSARQKLLELVAHLPPETSLPTLAKLGEKFTLHPSTIFRLLRDLTAEGLVWQSPTGRFFPVSAQSRNLRGVPVCFIGREMWHWSQLYQEILEGISEVCSANSSPLILFSSPTLVRQVSATLPPQFASPIAQGKYLKNLLSVLPRGCAGFIFDHLWSTGALEKIKSLSGQKVQLLHGDGRFAKVLAPDYDLAASMALEFAKQRCLHKVALVLPFAGDPAIELAYKSLKNAFADYLPLEIDYSACRDDIGEITRLIRQVDLLICTEDNVADALSKMLAALPGTKTKLLGTQGTGILHTPHSRLRIDYRRLGRSAAAHILHGTNPLIKHPILVTPS